MAQKRQTAAEMRKELATLKQQLTASTKPATTKRTKKTTTSRSNSETAGFVIEDQLEKSVEYGIDYCHINFVQADGSGISSAPEKKSDPLGFEAKTAIKAARWGIRGRGKYRYDRNARAWSGVTASVPQIVLDNLL